MDAASSEPHVVVIGGGFAGLWCTRALATAPVQITLVDRANHHLFQPLLYQVATAGLSAGDIAAPLRHILSSQRNVTVRLGEVTAIDTAARRVALADGTSVAYAYLLVASGATHAYFGHDEWAAHAPGLKTLDDAMNLRRRILLAFEQAENAVSDAGREAWLTFAIVGGGPTGVELAGTLAEIAHHTLKNEFRHIDPARAVVQLIEAGPRVLANFPPVLSEKAAAQLRRLGVQLLTGSAVQHIDAEGYVRDGERVNAKTVLWAAGVAASPLGAMLGAPRDRAGRMQVQPDLSVPGLHNVFVAGDLATLTQTNGKPVPGVAPAAKQMGVHVAKMICARLAGHNEATPFVYRDWGNLATIGRMAAVVDMPGGLKFSGVLAWWFWLAAHVFFLIGFRNRLVVLMNWGWAYTTYQRHARVVFGTGLSAGGPPSTDSSLQAERNDPSQSPPKFREQQAQR
jgi:NADH:ubiquinone reductase (H+-translocating)